ncbi:MAG: hypothetical protein GX684_05615 [Ruminococcaceae bacterium]|nr:hypothetical protein [Oscillospiraceae bacterium]
MKQQRADKLLLRRRVLIIIIPAVLLALALSLFLMRDKIRFGGKTGSEPLSLPVLYENSVITACGDKIAIADSFGLMLKNFSGKTVSELKVPLAFPALVCNDNFAVAYSVGERYLLKVSSGESLQLSVKGRISDISISANGMLAVTSSETGYRGAVTIYDTNLSPVYTFLSAKGFPLCAKVSHNGKVFAAVTVSDSNSAVHLFSLDSEEPLGVYSLSEAVIRDVFFIGNNELCCISENEATFIDLGGNVLASYAFNDKKLDKYCGSDDGFVCILLSDDNSHYLYSLGTGANVLGSLTYTAPINSLSAKSSYILVADSEKLMLYNRNLSLVKENKPEREIARAQIGGSLDAIVTYAGGGIYRIGL